MLTVHPKNRISVSNILVTTDFSPASKLALPYAIALGRQYEARIFTAHVLDPEPHLSVPLDPRPPQADAMWLEAERRLAEFSCPALFGSMLAKAILQRGGFWDVISDIIETNKIDLIVTGTRGRTGIRKLVLGSSAEAIFRRALCPVLTIGPKVSPLKADHWQIKSLLFPTDGSATSLAALPYALSLAEENQATLIFLQLVALPIPEYRECTKTEIRESLVSLVPAGADAWCTPEFVVRNESPAEGILRLADERVVDLIVMGVRTSPNQATRGRLPWPIASQVVAEAKCPVMTIRTNHEGPEKEFV